MSSYPTTAGFKDTTTSKDAADKLEASGRARTLRDKVETFFLAGNRATADEVASALFESPLAIRPRVSELFKKGVIERTGERRRSSNGNSSHVYRRTVHG